MEAQMGNSRKLAFIICNVSDKKRQCLWDGFKYVRSSLKWKVYSSRTKGSCKDESKRDDLPWSLPLSQMCLVHVSWILVSGLNRPSNFLYELVIRRPIGFWTVLKHLWKMPRKSSCVGCKTCSVWLSSTPVEIHLWHHRLEKVKSYKSMWNVIKTICWLMCMSSWG